MLRWTSKYTYTYEHACEIMATMCSGQAATQECDHLSVINVHMCATFTGTAFRLDSISNNLQAQLRCSSIRRCQSLNKDALRCQYPLHQLTQEHSTCQSLAVSVIQQQKVLEERQSKPTGLLHALMPLMTACALFSMTASQQQSCCRHHKANFEGQITPSVSGATLHAVSVLRPF